MPRETGRVSASVWGNTFDVMCWPIELFVCVCAIAAPHEMRTKERGGGGGRRYYL